METPHMDMITPDGFGLPYAWSTNNGTAVTCPACGAVIPINTDRYGEQIDNPYGDHYEQELQREEKLDELD